MSASARSLKARLCERARVRVCVYVRARVRACMCCVRAFVRARVRACVSVYVRACVRVPYSPFDLSRVNACSERHPPRLSDGWRAHTSRHPAAYRPASRSAEPALAAAAAAAARKLPNCRCGVATGATESKPVAAMSPTAPSARGCAAVKRKWQQLRRIVPPAASVSSPFTKQAVAGVERRSSGRVKSDASSAQRGARAPPPSPPLSPPSSPPAHRPAPPRCSCSATPP
mmetsp:Transcript_44746/g.103345  ORF Transcript_44746/g.103345 Transcript_44746/m.103345 type:complete len:229 (+) Transcript_44746:2171-2857(+)